MCVCDERQSGSWETERSITQTHTGDTADTREETQGETRVMALRDTSNAGHTFYDFRNFIVFFFTTPKFE